MGVDGFRRGRGPEKPGHLGKTLLVRFDGEGQITAVGLGFPGKGLL